jgi:hypothetical protein
MSVMAASSVFCGIAALRGKWQIWARTSVLDGSSSSVEGESTEWSVPNECLLSVGV